MQTEPEYMGRLTIRFYVAFDAPDQHGRLNGRWCTMLSQFIHRDSVEKIVDQFCKANPDLLKSRERIDVAFVTREHFPL